MITEADLNRSFVARYSCRQRNMADVEQDLAVIARRNANEARKRAYLEMVGRSLLDPTAPRTISERLWHRERIFVPGVYFTPTWTPEAQHAYYGHWR